MFTRAAAKAGPNLTHRDFHQGDGHMMFPRDIFGAARCDLQATKRLGSDASRLSQIRTASGKWFGLRQAGELTLLAGGAALQAVAAPRLGAAQLTM